MAAARAREPLCLSNGSDTTMSPVPSSQEIRRVCSMTICKCSREPHSLGATFLIEQFTNRRKYMRSGINGVLIQFGCHHCQKYGFRIRCSRSGWIQRVWDHGFDLASQTIPTSNKSIMQVIQRPHTKG